MIFYFVYVIELKSNEENIGIINITSKDVYNVTRDNSGNKDKNTYIINLDNCNGITTKQLDVLEKTGIDFKFKIKDNFF